MKYFYNLILNIIALYKYNYFLILQNVFDNLKLFYFYIC